MSKFKTIINPPTKLDKGDYVIDKPSFLEQVQENAAKKPKTGLTGTYYLRAIVDSIAAKYSPGVMTAYVIKSHLYEGRPFKTDEDVNNIILEALTKDYPAIFPLYLDNKIKTRPAGTKMVYYVDSGLSNAKEIFYANGFSEEQVAEKGKTFKVDDKGNSKLATDAEVDKINSATLISEEKGLKTKY